MPEIRFQPNAQRGISPVGRIILVVLFVALLVVVFNFGSVRSSLANMFSESYEDEIAKVKNDPKSDRIVVWVTRFQIPAFTRISRGMLEERIFNREAIEKGGQLTKLSQISGRVTVRDIPEESTFTERMLAPANVREGIAAGIEAGWGAIALQEDRLEGQIDDLHVGDRVAIIATIGGDGKEVEDALAAKVAVVSQLAKVLKPLQRGSARSRPKSPLQQMLDSRADMPTPENEIPALTLQMPSEDIVRLAQVGEQARLKILLMSNLPDGSELKLDVPSMETPAPPAVPTPGVTPVRGGAAPNWKIEVIRGGKKSVEEVGSN